MNPEATMLSADTAGPVRQHSVNMKCPAPASLRGHRAHLRLLRPGGGWGRGERRVMANRHRVSFGGDTECSPMDHGDSHTHLGRHEKPLKSALSTGELHRT